MSYIYLRSSWVILKSLKGTPSPTLVNALMLTEKLVIGSRPLMKVENFTLIEVQFKAVIVALLGAASGTRNKVDKRGNKC